jgi:hypothetical protein
VNPVPDFASLPRIKTVVSIARSMTASGSGRDPEATVCRGAYSYPLTGDKNAARRLAAPAWHYPVCAGEATDFRGQNGTVHGAIASGQRAASEVLSCSGQQ